MVCYLRRNGEACNATANVSNSPALSTSCGARKMQNTMQSRYDTGPSNILSGTQSPEITHQQAGVFLVSTQPRYPFRSCGVLTGTCRMMSIEISIESVSK